MKFKKKLYITKKSMGLWDPATELPQWEMNLSYVYIKVKSKISASDFVFIPLAMFRSSDSPNNAEQLWLD